MIRYLYEKDEALVAWAEERIAQTLFRNDAQAIGIKIDHQVRAVCVFDNFSPNSCFVSIASDGSRKWMTREFAVRCMAYPFLQCKFRRISCLIAANNRASIRYTEAFGGWVREGRVREGAPDGSDLILYGMLARDCRWLAPVIPLAIAV